MLTKGLLQHRLFRTIAYWALAGALACSRGDTKNNGGVDPGAAVAKLIITPATITISPIQFVALQAYGITVDGDSVAVAVDWTATGGVLFSNGSFSSSKNGVFEVVGRARDFPTVRDTAVVTVSSAPPTLVDIVINPVSPIFAPNETRPFTVEAHYSDSTVVPDTPVNWTATGGAITANGDYTAGSTPGSFQVIATSTIAAVADTVSLTINTIAPVVQSIVLSPDTITMRPGGQDTFHAFALYSDGTFAPAAVTFTASGGTITSTGRYTASQVPGTYKVIALHPASNNADTSTVTVAASSLAYITLSPPTVALTTGTSQLFTVQGTFTDSSKATVSVNFSATGGAITSGGTYTAGQVPGTYSVIATTPSALFSDTASVTINAASAHLTSIQVNPTTLSILVGATQQFNVVGLLSDGTTVNVNVNWTASGGTVTSGGFYTAPQQAGSYRVIATTTVGAFADTTLVTVNPVVTLTKINVTPASTSVLTGAIQQFTATGQLSNGGTTGVSVNWSATGGTITGAGQYTAGNTAGNFQVIAVEQGGTLADTASVAISVLPPPGSPLCTNEPPGMSKLFETPWDAVPPVAPATDAFGWDVGGAAQLQKLSIFQDATAPKSPSNTMAGKFPAGAPGGSAPFHMDRNFNLTATSVYVCLFTKLDPGFTNNGNVGTKFGFILTPYHGTAGLNHYFNLTTNLGINLQSSGGVLNRNMLSTFSLVGHRGVWVKIEFLVVSNNQGSSDGIARMWVNGGQVLNVNNVEYFLPSESPAFNGITWNPTYGGGLNPVPYNMFQYVDHWYVSVK